MASTGRVANTIFPLLSARIRAISPNVADRNAMGICVAVDCRANTGELTSLERQNEMQGSKRRCGANSDFTVTLDCHSFSSIIVCIETDISSSASADRKSPNSPESAITSAES